MANILLLCNDQIAEAFLDAASHIIGQLPDGIKQIGVCWNKDSGEYLLETQQYLNKLGDNKELLILTDMYGSTPCNLAQKLNVPTGVDIAIVAGLNLPMLIRALNYINLPLCEVKQKAVEGAIKGVVSCVDS